jgi:epoxyqueuosine reductase
MEISSVRHTPSAASSLDAAAVQRIALDHGFDLAGIAPAAPLFEADHYLSWARRGLAGRMGYLTDHRAGKRRDPRLLLESARSILVVGQLYNSPAPYSSQVDDDTLGWISRYAWGEDYHDVMRTRLEAVDRHLQSIAPCQTKICVDTAPLLERPLARAAGLGWIGKNTCLINQSHGSWFFLGELLLSLDLAPGTAPPDRCGSCSRCIDACPTAAIVPTGHQSPAWELDARLCISYLNIECKGEIPEPQRSGLGRHIFGCDICQDVCPWNRRAAVTSDPAFQPRHYAPPLEQLAALTPQAFLEMFRDSPVARTRYQGFLRNVAIAMGNAALPAFRAPLQKLAENPDPVIAGHARWALQQLE